MFNFAGKQAVDGAVKRLMDLMLELNPLKIAKFMDTMSQKIPIIGDVRRAYNSMSDEQRAEVTKNLIIAGAALAAQMASKNGKKIEF